MSQGEVVDLIRNGLWLTIEVAGPMLIMGLIVGLIVSVIQTTTSIQEQTLTFIPKLVAIFFAMLVFGPYMIESLVSYTQDLILKISTMRIGIIQ